MADLSIWMNGERVGTWSHRQNQHSLSYSPTWLTSPRARSLSLSMPLAANPVITGAKVAHYFDNLLPDSENIRQRLRSKFNVLGQQSFDLLTSIGRDCIGAAQLLPPDEEPIGFDRLNFKVLHEAEIAGVLREVPLNPSFAQRDTEDFRISLAGAQEKTALLKVGEQWCIPKGSTPSSHIFKLPMGRIGTHGFDWQHSVENEWLCLQILGACGLKVAKADMAQFEDQKALIVERFDRQWMTHQNGQDQWLARLPQEDFCQILGLPPRLKYQADGGPGIEDCLRVLSKSESAHTDTHQFVLSQFVFWLLAAIDGHGKNFSIRLHPRDCFELCPIYDVLSAWPIIGTGANHLPLQRANMAMALKGHQTHYLLQQIQTRHWLTLASQCCVPSVWDAILELAQGVDSIIDSVQQQLPNDFPPKVADKIFQGIQSQTKRFLAGLSSN